MVIATGFFDGVHLGHRLVIEQLVKAASAREDKSMIITFWPHPRNVLQQEARTLRLLTSLEEKKRLLYAMGVDRVEVVPFTREFSTMTTVEYLSKVIVGKYGGKAVILGYDNRIGADRVSSLEVARMADTLGLEVIFGEMVPSSKGYAVSSTKIREALGRGEVEFASRMLGYDYSLSGVVVSGNQIGRTIGFPTANMQLYEPLKCVPSDGVYLVRVEALERTLYGMCNIGCRPTVSLEGHVRTIETNIFDFHEDIYGLDMKISFLRKIRDEKKFLSLEELRSQLGKDRELCLEYI